MNSRRTRNSSLTLLALALFGLTGGSSAQAETTATYYVDVNTSGISGLLGYLDFQFDPNDATAVPATAGVNGFQTDATAISMVYSTGDVSGSPASGLAFDNGQATNQWTDQLTFGTYVSFDVTLSTSVTGGSGSTFYLTLLDSNGDDYSTGPATVTIGLNPDGSTTAMASAPVDGVSPTATVTMLAVPEPSTLLMGIFAIATFLGCDRLRRLKSVPRPGIEA